MVTIYMKDQKIELESIVLHCINKLLSATDVKDGDAVFVLRDKIVLRDKTGTKILDVNLK